MSKSKCRNCGHRRFRHSPGRLSWCWKKGCECREFVAMDRIEAPDAIVVARRMTEEEFPAFREGLLKERKGSFAGEDWADKYLAILLPERMMHASILANEMKVPWGLAFLRCQEAGWDKMLPSPSSGDDA